MICLSLSRMDCLWSLPDEVALSSSTRRLIGSGSALLNSAACSAQGNGSSFNNSVVRAVLDTTQLPASIAGFNIDSQTPKAHRAHKLAEYLECRNVCNVAGRSRRFCCAQNHRHSVIVSLLSYLNREIATCMRHNHMIFTRQSPVSGWSLALIGNASASKFPRRRAEPEAFSRELPTLEARNAEEYQSSC